jgi:N-acetylmuramoyl-L-alanine amidase
MRLFIWLHLLLIAADSPSHQLTPSPAHASAPSQVVCIDPGHPSEIGRGTTGKKLTEIHANWVEALLLKQRLEKRGIKVVLTKPSESRFVRNEARAAVANEAHASLMIRLHCDSASGTGFTTYIPAQQGIDRGFRGPSESVLKASRKKGEIFHTALAAGLKGKLRDNGLKGDQATAVGSRHGALIGSIYSKVPVVLVEMAVLTNPSDEAFLCSSTGRAAMADALAAGVVAVLRSK